MEFIYKFWDVTTWYQSLGLRDSGTYLYVFGLKPWIDVLKINSRKLY